MGSKVNICVALSGAVTRKGEGRGMTPYIPITPDELAEDAKRCFDAGANIIHIHVRDPKTQLPFTADKSQENVDAFRETYEKIKDKCPTAILNLTTGGGYGQTYEQRLAPAVVIKPEMASFTSGSGTFGLYSKSDDKFVYDNGETWTFKNLLWFADTLRQNNVKPECEIYEMGMLSNIKMIEYAFKPPLQLQFVMGLHGQVTPATPRHLIRLVDSANEMFNNFAWSVCAAGLAQWEIVTLGAILGAQTIRVGLEDNLYLEPGVLGSNAQMVEKAVTMARGVGREIASPEEGRIILSLV